MWACSGLQQRTPGGSVSPARPATLARTPAATLSQKSLATLEKRTCTARATCLHTVHTAMTVAGELVFVFSTRASARSSSCLSCNTSCERSVERVGRDAAPVVFFVFFQGRVPAEVL